MLEQAIQIAKITEAYPWYVMCGLGDEGVILYVKYRPPIAVLDRLRAITHHLEIRVSGAFKPLQP